MITRKTAIVAACLTAGWMGFAAPPAEATFDVFFDIDVECRGRPHTAQVPDPGGTSTVPIEIVALSLRSANPVDLSGGSFNVDSFFDIAYQIGPPGSSFQVDSFFDIDVDIHFNSSGPPSGDTRTFDTEMVALDLVSAQNPGVVYRVGMLGQMSVQDLGNGSLRYFDSFFDVFTEVSYDGGDNFAPTSPPAINVPIAPEPASLALLCISGLALLSRRR